MLTHEEVLSGVIAVLDGFVDVSIDCEIRADSSLRRDLGFDSFDFMEILFKLEKAFPIKINYRELFEEDLFPESAAGPDFFMRRTPPPEDPCWGHTVGCIAKYILKKLAHPLASVQVSAVGTSIQYA